MSHRSWKTKGKEIALIRAVSGWSHQGLSSQVCFSLFMAIRFLKKVRFTVLMCGLLFLYLSEIKFFSTVFLLLALSSLNNLSGWSHLLSCLHLPSAIWWLRICFIKPYLSPLELYIQRYTGSFTQVSYMQLRLNISNTDSLHISSSSKLFSFLFLNSLIQWGRDIS